MKNTPICENENWRKQNQNGKDANANKEQISTTNTQTQKKSLCVILVSSCRLTQKECPEACRHAHRKMQGTAVIFKPFADPPLSASVIVPVSFALLCIDKQTDKKLQTSGVKIMSRNVENFGSVSDHEPTGKTRIE